MEMIYKSDTARPAEPIPALIRRLLLSWLLAVTAEYALLPGASRDLAVLDGLQYMKPGRMALIGVACFALLWGISRLRQTASAERWTMVGLFAVLAAQSLGASFTWPFLVVCLMVLGSLACYARCGWNGGKIPEGKKLSEQNHCLWLVVGFTVAFFLLVSIWTVCRVYSFSTPSYDFSIFAQMFHSMRTTGLPTTTIERDGALSHFAVHVSPIYYLMLPFYWIAPYPAVLQVLQAAVLASGVIPLWKLGKCHGLASLPRALLCLLLLLYPAYAGGTSYDIHENVFLTPLLLWLFYGMDVKRPWLVWLAGGLTLLVKEDAAVYVALAAIYLILRAVLRQEGKRQTMAGTLLLVGALGYFVMVTGYLSQNGDGVMTYRYQNFMYDGSYSLITVVKAVVICPMKALYECVDREKLEFLTLTILPLGGLPFLTRRYERLVLLIPYVLVNLMSDYQYQHSIFFQYTYGSTACLIYLVLVNVADLKQEARRRKALLAALCIGAVCFGAQIVPLAVQYPARCIRYEAYYSGVRETLSVIPEDAEVAATTYYTTYLSQRAVLYDVRYASQEHLLSCEYLALNPKESKSYQKYGGFESLEKMLQCNGFEEVASYSESLVIYRKK